VNPLPGSTDVFVIGGGPAGLAAAIAARRRGFHVTLADCSVPPIDKACGEGIMPDGLAAARELGLELDRAEAYPFRGIRFCDGAAAVESPFPHGCGAGLRRTALHRLMTARAAEDGVRLVWGARVGGLRPHGVEVNGGFVRASWIVGADGGNSLVRRWAGLDACVRDSRRFGFRRHYPVAPWSEFMEIHWGDGCQVYVTPVAAREICVVLISRNQRLRLDDALPHFPELARRLAAGGAGTLERGGISASRRLRQVARGRVALVGDASGSVDAITGEGLCLLFQQALALAEAMREGDLRRYESAHRRIGQRPAWMARLMLLMGRRNLLRRRAMRAFAAQPRLFAGMLAMHVGEISVREFLSNGAALGWHMLTV
jgi:flavin-dependent dehydrogenase